MVNSIDISKAKEKPKMSLEEILAKYETTIRSQTYARGEDVKGRIAKIEKEFTERYVESYSQSGSPRNELESKARIILKS